ncbi:hypothetical protein [Mesobacillus boroniphilus]|uniref:hypothetical protein n=1 Tax=Mesobacillus boroniphilus TaxID=308892 RepID=UPI0004ACFF39|nr:hypothetical protein [Mesobacillus boroniphilus]
MMSKNKKIVMGLALASVAFIIMMFSTMPSAGSKEITIATSAKMVRNMKAIIL